MTSRSATTVMDHARAWTLRPGRVLSLDQPRLMGILNVTPDSFSDGGRYPEPAAACEAALRMIEEGAAVIDVGGESTRPGAERVEADEQTRRVVPVIAALRERSDVLITIDTTLAVVAEAALDAGADAINDVSAGRDDARMFPLAVARGCGMILMHRRVRPSDDSYSDRYAEAPQYDDVVAAVTAFLRKQCEAAERAGVPRERLMIDPGLGFGKSVEQNYEIIARTRELTALGPPVLGAASCKSFIGAVSGVENPADRVIGSTAVSVVQYLGGVRLFRVHDVAAHRQALAVAAAASW